MDTKRVLLIGGGILVVGGFIVWFRKYEANKAASQDTQSLNDAQLASMMLQQPLAYAGNMSAGSDVSGPTVSTGNESLQTLINSVLNPQQSASTPSAPSVDTRNPVQTVNLPENTVTPQPVMIGTYNPTGNSIVNADSIGTVVKTKPALLQMPVYSNRVM